MRSPEPEQNLNERRSPVLWRPRRGVRQVPLARVPRPAALSISLFFDQFGFGQARGTCTDWSRCNVRLVAPGTLDLWYVLATVAVLLARVADAQAKSNNVRFGSKADI